MRRRTEAIAVDHAGTDTGSAVDSLQRGLEVLRCFKPGEDTLASAEIARRLALPKATTRRLLDTLSTQGFVLRVPDTEAWRLHVACFVVGQAVLNGSLLVRKATPILQVLANRFAVHALLCARDRSDMLVLVHLAGTSAPPWALGAGARLPIADTAPGRAWLWTQPPAAQGEWLARLRDSTPSGRTQAAGVYQAFHDIEQGGACFSFGEWRRDVGLAAAPLMLADGSKAVVTCVRLAAEPGRGRFERECTAAMVEAAAMIRDEAQHAHS